MSSIYNHQTYQNYQQSRQKLGTFLKKLSAHNSGGTNTLTAHAQQFSLGKQKHCNTSEGNARQSPTIA